MKQELQKTAGLLCALLPAVGCMAAQSPKKVESGDSTVIKLQDVEVVANRANERTPVTFTNLTSEEIQRANDGSDIPFILSSTPSVVTTGDAGGWHLAIRRCVCAAPMLRASTSPPTVCPSTIRRATTCIGVNMPDLASSLRDIQIQRGAGTSTNGAGAFGASVNMITATPLAPLIG